jgi:hypothetical protein
MLQRVVLSWGNDEHLPVLLDIGHNLKEENLYDCESNMLMSSQDYFMIHRTFLYNNMQVNMFLTHYKDRLIHGFFYYNNKEFKVIDHRTYRTLQIGEFCYDNINIVRLSQNPFDESVIMP